MVQDTKSSRRHYHKKRSKSNSSKAIADKRKSITKGSTCDSSKEPTTPNIINLSINGDHYSYAVMVIDGAIPQYYVCGKNFHKIAERLKEKTQVLFKGPKGVGKTICLLAHWAQYIAQGKKTILLGVNTIIKFNDFTVKSYLESKKINYDSHDPMSCQNAIAEYIKKDDPIVLLDLSYFTDEAGDKILFLARVCHTASHCMIAMSSGSGVQLTDTRFKEKVDGMLNFYEKIEFSQFDKNKAILFIKTLPFNHSTIQPIWKPQF